VIGDGDADEEQFVADLAPAVEVGVAAGAALR
jgi:hypothetical protein